MLPSIKLLEIFSKEIFLFLYDFFKSFFSLDCTDFLGNHSATVAKTVAQDLESGRVSEEKAVFNGCGGGI